jgi:drug/metabolite transporter (DMT)-like permease
MPPQSEPETDAKGKKPSALTAADRSAALGYLFGATMALGAATSFAVARSGSLQGLAPHDLILVRSVVSGLVMLPFLSRWGLSTLAGIGWRRGLVLLLTGGPLMAFLLIGGYAFAPLAHGAIISPSAVTVLSTLAAVALLGERLTRAHVIGGTAVIAGVLLVSWQGLAKAPAADATWLGDLMFAASSVLWAAFTVLMRKWRLEALRATAVVAVLSATIVIPGYLIFHGIARLETLSLGPLVTQGLVQGLLHGVISIFAYTKAIAILGVSRAVLFPAIVPAISVLIGIPIVGEWPDALQVAGLFLVTLGLLTAVGLSTRSRRSLRPPAPNRCLRGTS